MPQSIMIDNREYFLVHAFPHTKPVWRVTPIGERLWEIATIYQEKNGEFYFETMGFFVLGFDTPDLAQEHIDRVYIPNATVLQHDDESFRVDIKRAKIYGFKSDMQALQRLREIITP